MGALADLISNPGSGGYEFEADLLGANYIPKSKLVYGDDGTATNVTATTPWPIQLRNTSGTEIGTNAAPIQIGDAGSSITVDGAVTVSGTATVSGTVAATQSGTWNITDIVNVVSVDDNAGSLTVDDGGSSLTVDGTVAATQSGTWNIATLTDITNVVSVDDNGSTLSIDDGGSSITVDGTITANPSQPATPSTANVAGVATSTTILASNVNRKGAVVYNDSTAILYLLYGSGTASATSFTYKLFPEDSVTVEAPVYTGQINGVWASATGAARVTELT